MNDSLSDFFTRLRNALYVGHPQVFVPFTKFNQSCARVLIQQGFLHPIVFSSDSVKTFKCTFKYTKQNRPLLTHLRRLSRPGCRFYIQAHQIPKDSPGILLISTSQGILSDREARHFKIGGEVLGIVS